MATRTVELDRNDLDKSIEVLSSAKTLQLTLFEKLSYRTLIVSVDVAALCFIAVNILAFFFEIHETREHVAPTYQLVNALFLLAVLIGLVALALNVPLFLRVFRERKRLKELGLNSLTESLWKEVRWRRSINVIHGGCLMGVVLLVIMGLVLAIIEFSLTSGIDLSEVILQAIGAIVAVSLFAGTRYLQIQRERMNLTANAEELRKAFQSLRQRAGKAEVVTVPSELVEQTAKIESAQIAKERKDAILESVSSRPSGYAIAFDRDAAEQRATLDIADRIELADLVAQLSIAGMKLEPREGMQRDKTKGNRVEIDYVIDNAFRSIHVVAVRRVREVSDASVSGASHA